MPLLFAKPGEAVSIKKISGKEEICRHLENLGFVVGSMVTVVSSIGRNLIVNAKQSRVVFSREMAQKSRV